MRAAAVQLHSTDERDRNLEKANQLTLAAVKDGAELIVLPEKFNVLGTSDQMREGAEPLDGPTVTWASDLAKEQEVWLVAGSIVEYEKATNNYYNTSVLLGPDGEVRAHYRKIHMFDVEVGGVTYRESDLETSGDGPVTADIGESKLGMAVCYDLRFPEVFRILALEGAEITTLPSAFTMATGKSHWHVLIRARAIENQFFMIAAGQVGEWPAKHHHFGHSVIVDPWGTVLTEVADGETYIVADLDLNYLQEVRSKLPSLANRKPTAYKWP